MTTLNDYRLISLATLNPQMDIPGWTKNNDFQSLCDSIWTGFKAAVYEKTNINGKKTIVIAFECFQSFNDLPSVIQSITGFHSLQENNADILYNAVKEYYINDDIQIEFTGLSYGGTLAQLMGIKHSDSQVVTFAALSASNIYGVNTNIFYDNIENHISR